MAFLIILFSLSAAALFITVSGEVIGSPVIAGNDFVIEVTAIDDEPLIGVAARLSGDEWQAQSCDGESCIRDFTFTAPSTPGAYNYELYARNERNQEAWNLIQVNVVNGEADEFTLRVACIDGPAKDNNNIIFFFLSY